METIVHKISLKERKMPNQPLYNNTLKVITAIYESSYYVSEKDISNRLIKEGVNVTPSNVGSILTKIARRLGSDVLIRRNVKGILRYAFTTHAIDEYLPNEIYYQLYLKMPYVVPSETNDMSPEEEYNKPEEYDEPPEPTKESSTDININLNIKGKIDIVFSFEKMLDN